MTPYPSELLARSRPVPVDKVQAVNDARFIAAYRLTYLTSAVFRLPVRYSEDIPIACITANGFILLSPFALNLPVDALATVLAHETLHWTLDFWGRRGSRSFREWWLAHDIEVNGAAFASGLPDPLAPYASQGMHSATAEFFGFPKRLAAEEYYDLLMRNGLPGSPKDSDSRSDSDSDQESNAGGGSGSSFDTEAPDLIEGDGAGDSDDHSSVPEELRGLAVGQHERQALLVKTAKAAVEALNTQPGSVPGSLVRTLRALAGLPDPADVDWRDLLRAELSMSLSTVIGQEGSYAWHKPPRKILGGIIYPRRLEVRPEIAIVVDTSGSICDDLLRRFVAELVQIVNELGSVIAIACDCDVRAIARIGSAEEILNMLAGGGGTDMCVGIDRAVREGAEVIVVLTDGETPWPNTPAPVPVIAAVYGSDRELALVPKWIKAVDLAAQDRRQR